MVHRQPRARPSKHGTEAMLSLSIQCQDRSHEPDFSAKHVTSTTTGKRDWCTSDAVAARETRLRFLAEICMTVSLKMSRLSKSQNQNLKNNCPLCCFWQNYGCFHLKCHDCQKHKNQKPENNWPLCAVCGKPILILKETFVLELLLFMI